ncbi:MAG: membrane protein insertion efficiency factor YidD [Bdellovibrionaceae bacterium]|nr:membrane protein insertion efficiency factor YidD [Pseudobdellovibrionaceae bacterium]
MTSSAEPWTAGSKVLKSISKGFLLLLIGAYRTLGTTHMGGACRFTPSCSEYAVDTIHEHSFFKAIYLITKRILKCRPGGSFGFDPVPHASGECHARTK